MDWDVTGPWLCDCCGLAMVCAGKPCPECGSADGWTPMSQTAERPPCKCRHSRAYDCICPGSAGRNGLLRQWGLRRTFAFVNQLSPQPLDLIGRR